MPRTLPSRNHLYPTQCTINRNHQNIINIRNNANITKPEITYANLENKLRDYHKVVIKKAVNTIKILYLHKILYHGNSSLFSL